MTTDTEALPPLPEHDCQGCNGSGTIRAMTSHLGPDDHEFDQCCPACQGTGSADLRDAINALGYWTHKTDVERIVVERSAVLRIITARAALAQRQQVPEGWTIHLDADAAEKLKQTIGDDDTVSEITLSLCDGHEGRGLYVWLTEYPEEGSLLLAAAPALTAATQAAEPCQWCCRTGRFADHACRFCAGKGEGSVFAVPQAAQAQPQEPPRSAPLTEEQAIAIAAYYDVTSAMVRDIYNRAHGISTPEEPKR